MSGFYNCLNSRPISFVVDYLTKNQKIMKFKALTPNLIVESVNTSLDFYQNTLGFSKIVSVPEEGEYAFAIIKAGDISIMLQSKESYHEENPVFGNTPIGGTFVLFIDIDGVDELYAKIKNDVEIIVDMHTTFYGTSEFAIKDINGYIITFAEDKK